MNAKLHLAIAAERALADGRSLGDELRALASASSGLPARWRTRAGSAAVWADEGKLMLAMSELPVDPLVAAATLYSPKSAARIGSMLRALPSPWTLLAPLIVPGVYVMGVLLIELGVATLTGWKVMPVFAYLGSRSQGANMALPMELHHFATLLAGLCLLGGPVAILFAQVRAGGRLGMKVFEPMRSGRLLATAAILAEDGIPVSTSIGALAGPARVDETTLDGLASVTGAGTRPIDAATCRELALFQAARAVHAARRGSVWLRLVGGLAACFIGATLAASMYLAILGLPRVLLQ